MPKREVKVLVPAHAWDTLVRETGLDAPDRPGEVWFRDTPDLAAHHQGIVLRARASDEGERGQTFVDRTGYRIVLENAAWAADAPAHR